MLQCDQNDMMQLDLGVRVILLELAVEHKGFPLVSSRNESLRDSQAFFFLPSVQMDVCVMLEGNLCGGQFWHLSPAADK